MKKIFIDTNLLLLLMFASLRRNPSADTRLSDYSAYDLLRIEGVVANFDKIVVTPNVLTEVSNKLKINNYEESMWLKYFIETSVEIYVQSQNFISSPLFPILGLADVTQFSDEFKCCSFLTDDGKLSNYLRANDLKVINIALQ